MSEEGERKGKGQLRRKNEWRGEKEKWKTIKGKWGWAVEWERDVKVLEV